MATQTPDFQQARRRMMLEAPIHRVIPQMALPTIVAFLINSVYSLADTYFVSSLGTNATAAVSVNASLDQLIMMCGSMLAVGASSYISRLLGQGKEHKASQVLSTAFFSSLVLGGILMAAGTIWMDEMVDLLGATPTCHQYAVDYATYVLLAAPFMACNFVTNQCLRSEGSAMLSMVGMGFGGVLNCVLDPVFIFNLEMGVAGASLATAISKLVSFAILMYPYLTRRSLLRLSVRLFCLSRDIVVEIITVGSSSMVRFGLAVVSAIWLNELAGNISDSVLAAIGVTSKLMMFPFSIILGFGNGFQPVVGFNWGAQCYDRVRSSYRFSAWTALIGSAMMAALLALFAPQIILAFADADPEMEELGVLCIRLQCLTLPIHAWVAVVSMLCTGLGNAGSAMVLATARQGSCFLPILYPMAVLFGVYGMVSVQAVADVISLVLAIPIAISMARKIHRAQEMAWSNGPASAA